MKAYYFSRREMLFRHHASFELCSKPVYLVCILHLNIDLFSPTLIIGFYIKALYFPRDQ